MPAKPYNTVEKTWYLAELEIPLSEIDNYTLEELHEMYRVRDIYPGVLISLEKDGFAANAVVTATDNGNGSITLASTPSSLLTKYSYAEATYFKIANAVQLAINPPQPSSSTPSAGVTQRAAREDHSHLIPPQPPVVANTFGAGANGWLTRPNGAGTTGTTGRGHFSLVYLSSFNRAPILASALGIYVTVAAAAGGVARYGLWRPASNGGLDLSAGNKVWESGPIATTSNGFKMAAFAPGSIAEGPYWWGVVMQTATCTVMQTDSGIYFQHPFNNQDRANLMYQDSITGAFPTSGGAPGGDVAPCLYYTAA